MLPFSLNAAMYKWVDEKGEIVYSDEPPHEGAEEIKPPGLTTTPAVKYTPKAKPEPEKKDSSVTNYTELRITNPANEDNIRDNEGNIAVTIAIAPALNTAEGHYLSLQLNGQTAVSKFTSTNTSISNVDRGSNTLSVTVHDKAGKSLKSSNTVTVFVHRFSQLHQKPK